MWRELLLDIKKVEEKYGETLNIPATNEQIDCLKKVAKEKFNHI